MVVATVKEEARRLVDELPDDAGWQELRVQVELREKIERGLADIAAGRTKSAEEIERKYGFKG